MAGDPRRLGRRGTRWDRRPPFPQYGDQHGGGDVPQGGGGDRPGEGSTQRRLLSEPAATGGNRKGPRRSRVRSLDSSPGALQRRRRLPGPGGYRQLPGSGPRGRSSPVSASPQDNAGRLTGPGLKHLDEFRDPNLAASLVRRIRTRSRRQVRIMEFCGTHTVSIFRHGIRELLPSTIELLSGPGCPICVTANSDLDWGIALAEEPDLIITTVGDMVRVPGSRSSLEKVKAEGADVRVVYSTLDALQVARENPDRTVVFLGIGFETTAPTVAASIVQAQEEGIDNLYLLSLHKLTPPAMRAILDSGESRLDGVIGA